MCKVGQVEGMHNPFDTVNSCVMRERERWKASRGMRRVYQFRQGWRDSRPSTSSLMPPTPVPAPAPMGKILIMLGVTRQKCQAAGTGRAGFYHTHTRPSVVLKIFIVANSTN